VSQTWGVFGTAGWEKGRSSSPPNTTQTERRAVRGQLRGIIRRGYFRRAADIIIRVLDPGIHGCPCDYENTRKRGATAVQESDNFVKLCFLKITVQNSGTNDG
jgi:hypothetical protein